MTILMLGITGSVIGSFGIGTFFAFPYMVPAQIAAEETQRTKKSNSAMFYGVQGTLVSISSALNDPV
jgi:Na+/melibiose symporter-like transporter